MSSKTSVLGIHVAAHDSAACIISDDGLCAAAEEERFTRVKHTAGLPDAAIDYCLDASRLGSSGPSEIAISYRPRRVLSTACRHALSLYATSPAGRLRYMHSEWAIYAQLRSARRAVKRRFPNAAVNFVEHHTAHAAAAFLNSPFDRAAVVVLDGYGESESITVTLADEDRLRRLCSVRFPNSIGLLYNAITAYLGFQPDADEGKVMALAGYGSPTYLPQFAEVAPSGTKLFRTNRRYFEIDAQHVSPRFLALFGEGRKPDQDALDERYRNIAASLQVVTESNIVRIVERAHELTGEAKLCLAGGVAQNCAANGVVQRAALFDEVFVHPASGDSGTALGAAAYAAYYKSGLARPRMDSACLGPAYEEQRITSALIAAGLRFRRVEDSATDAAALLADDQLVGCVQGRMEFGPRALGNRSILASPAERATRDYLNDVIKERESFRPYGAAVLHECGREFFEDYVFSPYMNVALRVTDEAASRIPAVVHVDGTSRIQSVDEHSAPWLYRALRAFEALSGLPVLLNTSFNARGEPLVCSPEDAVASFHRCQLRFMVIGPFVVERR